MQITSPPRTPSPEAQKLLFSYEGFAQIKLILGAMLFLLGLPILVLCLALLADEFSLWRGAIDTEAKITSMSKEYTDEGGDSRFDVRYQYQQNNETFEGEASLSVSNSAEVFVGKPIKITASQSNPGVSRAPGLDVYTGPFLLLLVLGGPFSVIGLWFLVSTIREKARRLRAYKYGTPITAKVLHAGDDLNTQISYVHPYLVTWEFLANGQKYEGSFTSMQKAPLAALAASKEVLVMYLPERPACNSLYMP